MQRQIVIYAPCGSCSPENERKILACFPGARFTGTWEEGAMMWQEALARAEKR